MTYFLLGIVVGLLNALLVVSATTKKDLPMKITRLFNKRATIVDLTPDVDLE